MAAELYPTHTPALFQAAVHVAAQRLRAGEVVALPTETVYGLAANAWNPAAVARIFAVKGRPANNPVIVHVGGLELARRCAAVWPDAAEQLARAFWPGPLTLVLPRGPEISDLVTAGGPTVGLRWPSHPFMPTVIRECGFPLAAPSANLSNQISPTNAEHVRLQLGDRIPLIVDGGQAQVGIESTVLDLSGPHPRLLRPGMIHAEAITAVLGVAPSSVSHSLPTEGPLPGPGMLPKHYAPRARLVMLTWRDESELRAQLAGFHVPPSACRVIAHTHIPASLGSENVSLIPHDAEAFARALYAEMHRCDQPGVELIVVEAPPEMIEWAGIRDRLRRAAA